MIESRFQKKNENGRNYKADDPKCQSKLVECNMNTEVISVPDKIEIKNNAE
jgi:hypothetical protein